jgi:hypothetical protein
MSVGHGINDINSERSGGYAGIKSAGSRRIGIDNVTG